MRATGKRAAANELLIASGAVELAVEAAGGVRPASTTTAPQKETLAQESTEARDHLVGIDEYDRSLLVPGCLEARSSPSGAGASSRPSRYHDAQPRAVAMRANLAQKGALQGIGVRLTPCA